MRVDSKLMAEELANYIPTVEQLMESRSVSFWLKNALTAALDRDCVDAANDAELLAKVLAKRCEA